jgi:CBS-domain-containing membrane protein
MEKKIISIVWTIIGSALIWGLTIILCALMLRRKNAKDVLFLVSAAAVVHFIVISVPLAGQFGKKKDGN